MIRTVALGVALILAVFGGAAATWFGSAPPADGSASVQRGDGLAQTFDVVTSQRASAAEVETASYPDGLPHLTAVTFVENTTSSITYSLDFEDSTGDLQRIEWRRPEGGGNFTTGLMDLNPAAKWKPRSRQQLTLPCTTGAIAFIRVADSAGNKSDWQYVTLDCAGGVASRLRIELSDSWHGLLSRPS